MPITMDTPLSTLLDDPQAKKVLDQYAPGVSTNPMIGMVRGMTLKAIVGLPQAAQLGLTEEKVKAFLAEVNKYVK